MMSRMFRGLGALGFALSVLAGICVPTVGAFAAEKTIRLALQPAPLLGFYVKEKRLLEKRGFMEGNTTKQADFVIERAFAEQ